MSNREQKHIDVLEGFMGMGQWLILNPGGIAFTQVDAFGDGNNAVQTDVGSMTRWLTATEGQR